MTLLESQTTLPPFKWTDNHIADLRRMWLVEERSSGEIAAEFGVTRNTVIGKIGRLGMQGRKCDMENRSKGAAMREARIRMRAARIAEKAAKPFRPALACEPAVEVPAAAPCALLELDDDKCHWPFGEPGAADFHFCGGRVRYRSYCIGHAQIAYRSRG